MRRPEPVSVTRLTYPLRLSKRQIKYRQHIHNTHQLSMSRLRHGDTDQSRRQCKIIPPSLPMSRAAAVTCLRGGRFRCPCHRRCRPGLSHSHIPTPMLGDRQLFAPPSRQCTCPPRTNCGLWSLSSRHRLSPGHAHIDEGFSSALEGSFPDPSSGHTQRRRRPRCPPTRNG